jgi:hypothetical protein
VQVLGLDRTQRGHVDELAAVAPHHRQVQTGQHGRQRDAGAVVDLGTGQAHAYLGRRVVDLGQFDVGNQLLADVGRHPRLAQFGGIGGSLQGAGGGDGE